MTESNLIKGTLERRKTSKWWYGSFRIDGRRKTINLHIEIRGTPPKEDEEFGSAQFERSKGEADSALKALLTEVNSKRTSEELAQAVHEARTGRKVAVHELQDLPQLWLDMPRNKPVSLEHRKKSLSRLNGFLDWIGNHYPNVVKLDHLSPQIAKEFMDFHQERGISPRTWNLILVTLKSACSRGGCTAFNDLKQKPADTVHRIPFTPEELTDVLEASKSDSLIYPLVVTATCTAMRKKDCCFLRWTDVDLSSGFITVKTSKTGRTVDIPLADLLRAEIKRRFGNRSEYVFPELVKQYSADDTLLTKRFKRCLAKAGFHDGKPPTKELNEYDPAELKRKAEDYFHSIPTEEKRNRIRTVFSYYTKGESLKRTAELAGVSKGSVSGYLNEIEAQTGIAFIRGKTRKPKTEITPQRGETTQQRKTGLNKASVRDFHALRTTWITLALMQGLPLELVQTITGHATAEVVMEHYFKPQREQLKEALQKCMPSMLTSSAQAREPLPLWAVSLIKNMTPQNCNEIKQELLSDPLARDNYIY